MQIAFDFGVGDDIEWLRDLLKLRFGEPGQFLVRPPTAQLVKSMISGRTRDATSLAAFERLIRTYAGWSEIAHAAPADIEAIIADVTFADVKARHLRQTLCSIAEHQADFSLEFLGAYPVEPALEWLERLPGVGRKVSASTLNFSTLMMPAFVVDTHVLRVLQRFGLVHREADTQNAYEVIMTALCRWTARALAELHILIKHLGQNICRADRPHCRSCPLSRRCRLVAVRHQSAGQSGAG